MGGQQPGQGADTDGDRYSESGRGERESRHVLEALAVQEVDDDRADPGGWNAR